MGKWAVVRHPIFFCNVGTQRNNVGTWRAIKPTARVNTHKLYIIHHTSKISPRAEKMHDNPIPSPRQ